MLPSVLERPRGSRTVVTRGPARRAQKGIAAAAALGILFLAPVADARGAPESFADLAAKVTPAVVNISTTQKVDRPETAMPDLPFPPGSPFEQFFKRYFEQQNRNQGPAEVNALGSGFVIDPAGYVVTNNHVVGKADEISVTLAGGDKFPAKIVGRDDKTDLALLKIEAGKPLPYVSLGDSNALRVGDWVMAVGNPFGLGGTVTAGIVSARGRDIHSGPFDDYLQIDASINRGNSGGPLFAMDGSVVGVNTAIFSPNGGSVGIGFAIPASMVKPIVAQLREQGKVDRGWLGVQIQPITPEIADSLGLKEAKGALVAGVMPDSPAARAGLRQGDVILSLDGQTIDALRDLPKMVAEMKAGKQVSARVWRQGRESTVQVAIGQMPQGEQVAAAEPGSPGAAQRQNVLGLALAPVTPETRQRFNIDDSVEGALIVAVKPDSEAARQGLRPGDVIVKVGDQVVKAPRDVTKKIDEANTAKQNAILVLLQRGEQQRFVALKLDRA